MKKLISLTTTVLVGVTGLLALATTPAVAAPAASSGAASAPITCKEWPATLTVKRRAPVHTAPSGRSGVMWFAAKGRTYSIGGYCDNAAGNRWFCVAGCDFRDVPQGFWIWEDYFYA